MTKNKTRQPGITRRRMLARLGLAATALYAAPVLLPLSNARASGFTGAATGPSYTRPSYTRPSYTRPSYTRPSYTRPSFSR